MNEREALVGALTMAALGGAAFTGRWDPVWVVGGAGLMGLGAGLVATRVVRWTGLGLALAALGGWLVADRALTGDRALWMTTVGVVVAVALTLGIGSLAVTGVRPAIVYWALIGTAAGIWACVPETDGPGRAMLVVGIAAAAAIVLERPVVPEVVGGVAGLMLFAGLQGGQFRSSAIVGMAGSFGLFLVIGALAGQVRSLGRRDVVVLGAHLVAVGLASRVAGRGEGLVRSVVVEVIALAGLVGATLVVSRTTEERRA